MVYKIFVAFVASLFALTSAKASEADPLESKTEARIQVQYSEAVHLFATMDHVSGWWTGFVEPVYREDWEKRFGWSEKDQQWADRYAEYRHRTYSDPSQSLEVATSPEGIFASSTAAAQSTDPLATFMVSQPDIEQAFARLDEVAGPEDAAMLRGFYRHFEPSWREVLNESQALTAHSSLLEAEMSGEKLSKFLRMVQRFYNAENLGTFRVFFTRFPSGTRTRAELVAGQNLILHAPLELDYQEGNWGSIVAHEIVHYISSQQSDLAKRAMSDRFLATCPIERTSRRLWMLEEPLAVAVGQAGYSHFVDGKRLDPNSNWYGNPWIDITARTLEASVIEALASGSLLEQTRIVEEAADRCSTLTFISENM
ncbi:hypothetical protein ACRAQ6_03795 [Erythrobacter sp. HA6-11]